jgi:hypothetical protein
MTDTMPMPSQRSTIPRNDSFSAEDLTKALEASASKARNDLSYRLNDSPSVPPPSPQRSRAPSVYATERRR